MSRRGAQLWITVVALVACVRVGMTWRIFSQTVDEPIHIACGHQWLTSGRYDLDVEHPPLARIGFALGLRHVQAREDLMRDERGTELLFTNDDYQHNLAVSRAGNLPWLLLGILSVALWTNLLLGRTAAVFAAMLFSMLTPVLAHAGLATTDMAACASVAFAIYAFERWLQQRTWAATLLLAVAIGIGIGAKMSFAFFFVPAAIVIWFSNRRVTRRESKRTAKPRYLATFATLLIVPVAIIAATYHFDVGTINDARVKGWPYDSPPQVAARYAKTPGYEWVRADIVTRYHEYSSITRPGVYVDFVDWAKHAGYPSPLAGRTGHDTLIGQPPIPPLPLHARIAEPFLAGYQWFATHVPLPAPMFIAGLAYVTFHASAGHSAYLFGHYSPLGWWYYFPVVLAFKTPVAFLILFAIGVVLRPRFGVMTLAMLVIPMLSHINIGVRHVLPVYAPMTVAAAAAAMWLMQKAKAHRVALCVLAAWLVIANVRAHPDYLPDFNELAGRHPERIANDSNFDWGQDLLRLAQYVKKHHLQPLHVAYFGSFDPHRLGIAFDDVAAYQHVHGWVAVTEMKRIFDPPEYKGRGFKWLDAYPYKRIGKAIRLYYVP